MKKKTDNDLFENKLILIKEKKPNSDKFYYTLDRTYSKQALPFSENIVWIYSIKYSKWGDVSLKNVPYDAENGKGKLKFDKKWRNSGVKSRKLSGVIANWYTRLIISEKAGKKETDRFCFVFFQEKQITIVLLEAVYPKKKTFG